MAPRSAALTSCRLAQYEAAHDFRIRWAMPTYDLSRPDRLTRLIREKGKRQVSQTEAGYDATTTTLKPSSCE